MISVQSDKPYAWKEVEVNLFAGLANQASDRDLWNAQLFTENQAALTRLMTTYEASEKIISELDPKKALDVLVSRVCDVVNAHRACAILIDEQEKPHHLASVGFEADLDLTTSIRPNGISLDVLPFWGTPIFSGCIETARQTTS